jgi:hypothetical protein
MKALSTLSIMSQNMQCRSLILIPLAITTWKRSNARAHLRLEAGLGRRKARYITIQFLTPPCSTVRAACPAHGATPGGHLPHTAYEASGAMATACTATGRCASAPCPSLPPLGGHLVRSLGTRCAVALWTASSPRRGACAIRPHPGVDGLPVLRLLRPLRHGLRPGGGVGDSLPSCPLPCASCRPLPVCVLDDSSSRRAVACCSRPPPRSAAPQAADRGRQGDRYGQRGASPRSGLSSGGAPAMARVTGGPLRQGRPGAPVPAGLYTLPGLHQGMPQPSHPVLRAGLPRMGPCRSMLLTP